jgi:hypothetical protein
VLVLERVDRERATFVPAEPGWASAVMPREAWEALDRPLTVRMLIEAIA